MKPIQVLCAAVFAISCGGTSTSSSDQSNRLSESDADVEPHSTDPSSAPTGLEGEECTQNHEAEPLFYASLKDVEQCEVDSDCDALPRFDLDCMSLCNVDELAHGTPAWQAAVEDALSEVADLCDDFHEDECTVYPKSCGPGGNGPVIGYACEDARCVAEYAE